MHNVFISYSSRDLAQAQTVRKVLESNQITCWMAPADIPGGSNYTKEIPIAIRGCQVFVLILSDNAQNSHWVLKELDSAVNNGKIILPFMLEDCALNDEFNFLLSGAQRYSAYQRKSEAMEKLVTRIRAIIHADGSSNVPEPEPEPIPPVQEPVIFEKVSTPLTDEIQCPACNSYNVTVKDTTGHPNDMLEQLVLILSPVVLLIAAQCVAFVAIVILFAFLDYNFDLMGIVSFVLTAGFSAGGIWAGIRFARVWIHRRHIRNHISVRACRCNNCAKKFKSLLRDSE